MRGGTPKWGQTQPPAWGNVDARGNRTIEPQHRASCSPHCKQREAERRQAHGKKEQKARRRGGGSGSGGEGRRLPEDPAELASVKISTAVPRAQNKHIGNARALQIHAARAKSRSVPPPALHPALLDGSSRGVPAPAHCQAAPVGPSQPDTAPPPSAPVVENEPKKKQRAIDN